MVYCVPKYVDSRSFCVVRAPSRHSQALHFIAMKPSTTAILLTLAIVIALAQCASDSSSRQRPRQSREEEDEIRFKRPFAYIVILLGLSIAPVIGRFLVCVLTDPVIPILFRELKNRAKNSLLKIFLSNRGDGSNNRVDVVTNKKQEVDDTDTEKEVDDTVTEKED